MAMIAILRRSTDYSLAVDRTLATLFKRCVECPDTTPSCPSCSNNEVCSLISQSCTACASTTCISDGSSTTQSSSPNVGAIAGGVVGGVLFVAAVTFAIWWFFIKNKRAQYEEEWEEDDIAAQKAAHEQFNMQRSERASVHTVNSVATSLLSRASNMIPIAYIPGVMNRDGRDNSNTMIPPVPPIPAARAANSSPSSNGEPLFFKPRDLRDSTYSETSSIGDRSTFYGRPSITPSLARSSIATFRDDAVANPMPAQTIMRAKANVVSVQRTSPNGTPQHELGAMDFGQQQQPDAKQPNILMPSSADPSNKLNGVSFGKPTLLTLTKKGPKTKGRFPVKNGNPAQGAKPIKSSPLAYKDDVSDSEDDDLYPKADSAVTPIQQSPIQSPFTDPKSPAKANDARNNRFSEASRQSEASFIGMGGLKSIAEVSSIIENATRRASRVPSHYGLGGAGDASPFGDEFETR